MTEFDMTNIEDACIYLRVKLHYDKHGIYLHQRRYIEKLLDKFNLI